MVKGKRRPVEASTLGTTQRRESRTAVALPLVGRDQRAGGADRCARRRSDRRGSGRRAGRARRASASRASSKRCGPSPRDFRCSPSRATPTRRRARTRPSGGCCTTCSANRRPPNARTSRPPWTRASACTRRTWSRGCRCSGVPARPRPAGHPRGGGARARVPSRQGPRGHGPVPQPRVAAVGGGHHRGHALDGRRVERGARSDRAGPRRSPGADPPDPARHRHRVPRRTGRPHSVTGARTARRSRTRCARCSPPPTTRPCARTTSRCSRSGRPATPCSSASSSRRSVTAVMSPRCRTTCTRSWRVRSTGSRPSCVRWCAWPQSSGRAFSPRSSKPSRTGRCPCTPKASGTRSTRSSRWRPRARCGSGTHSYATPPTRSSPTGVGGSSTPVRVTRSPTAQIEPEAEAELLSLHYFHANRFDDAWRFARVAAPARARQVRQRRGGDALRPRDQRGASRRRRGRRRSGRGLGAAR